MLELHLINSGPDPHLELCLQLAEVAVDVVKQHTWEKKFPAPTRCDGRPRGANPDQRELGVVSGYPCPVDRTLAVADGLWGGIFPGGGDRGLQHPLDPPGEKLSGRHVVHPGDEGDVWEQVGDPDDPSHDGRLLNIPMEVDLVSTRQRRVGSCPELIPSRSAPVFAQVPSEVRVHGADKRNPLNGAAGKEAEPRELDWLVGQPNAFPAVQSSDNGEEFHVVLLDPAPVAGSMTLRTLHRKGRVFLLGNVATFRPGWSGSLRSSMLMRM